MIWVASEGMRVSDLVDFSVMVSCRFWSLGMLGLTLSSQIISTSNLKTSKRKTKNNSERKMTLENLMENEARL